MTEDKTTQKIEAKGTGSLLEGGELARIYEGPGIAYYQVPIIVKLSLEEWHKIAGAGSWKVTLKPEET